MNDQFVGQTLAGKYKIEQYLREDATSSTYRAVQTSLDKPLTIKILNPALAEYADAVADFETEAKTLARIANPNILNVLDVSKDERGTPFIVLETSAGRTLREFIRETGGSSLERATGVVRQIADALTIAHSNNVFHGDLSSDKVLLEERGGGEDFVKILDFGVVAQPNFDDEKTVVRADLPFYKAPEQLSGANVVDSRADVYALGILLFEILTGKPPFVDSNAAALANKHLREIPPSLIAARPDLPPQTEQVVQRALAKQPPQRFQSTAEFAAALGGAAQHVGAAGTNAGYATNLENSARHLNSSVEPQNAVNNPYKTAFIVLSGIMVLSVLAIYLTGGFRNTPTTQISSDPNSQPVQPLNPASSGGEDLSNLSLQPQLGNNGNLDPTLVLPGGTVPGGAGIAPPMGGGIPPGLYPGGGQTVVVPGNSNSIFMGDLNSNVGSPANANRNVNANVAINANVKPVTNTNAAPTISPRPVNSNTGSPNVNPSPAPSVTAAPPTTTVPSPKQSPPRATPKPNDSPTKPAGTDSLSKSAPSGLN